MENPSRLTRREFVKATGITTMSVGLSDTVVADSSTIPSDFSIEHPENVVDSFIQLEEGLPYILGVNGWEKRPVTEQARTVGRLHPELFDAHVGVANSVPPNHILSAEVSELGHFSLEQGLPTAVQQYYVFTVNRGTELWYDSLTPDQKFTLPDGSVMEDFSAMAFRYYDGNPAESEFQGLRSIQPSVHVPAYRRFRAEVAKTMLAFGASGIYMDNAGVPTLEGLDFSDWAVQNFRDYLSELPGSERDRLGISDTSSFDIREYLDEAGIAPGQTENPATDSVYREFKLYTLAAHRTWFANYRAEVEEAFDERVENDGLLLTANQSLPSVGSLQIGDLVDAVYPETRRTLPPDRILDWEYKLGKAAGKFERPVVPVGNLISIGDELNNLGGLSPTEPHPDLLRLQVGEGYANGGVRPVTLTGWGIADEDQVADNWIQPDGSVPEKLQEIIDFVWANRRFLDQPTVANDVALVFSLPTAIWTRAPQWEVPESPHVDAFQGAASLLREAQLPYDVLMFGHRDLWNDPDQLDDLTDYRAIVLPMVSCLSDSQAEAIDAAVNEDTTVVVTDGVPDRSANFEPRTDIEETFDIHEHAVSISDTPGLTRHRDGQSTTNLIDYVVEGGQQVTISDSLVVPSVQHRNDPTWTIVHLVNYDYTPERDAVSPKTDIQLTVETQHPVQEARWVSPEVITTVPFDTENNRVSATIPELSEWGFLVLATSPSSLDLTPTKEAENAIADAQEAIEVAESEGRTADLTAARVALENAERGLDFDGADQSRKAAVQAADLAEKTGPVPVVGIDQAHNQGQTGHSYSATGKLRELFSNYEFREVTTWSQETLGELDLLIVPPTLDQGDYGYDVTSSDRRAVEAFVDQGGTLLLLGHGTLTDDAERLTEPFDVGFDGRMLVQPRVSHGRSPEEGADPLALDVVCEPSEFTRMTASWKTRAATSVTVGSSATVLANVPETTEAYINEGGPPEPRTDADEHAGGAPVLAAAPHGEGVVVALGSSEILRKPTSGGFGDLFGQQSDPIGKSVVTALATWNATDTSSTLTTETDDETDGTAESTSQDETESSTPGFGVLHAVGGLAVLVNYLRKRKQ